MEQEQEIRTRGEFRLNLDSIELRSHSDQNMTYYYSKFQLFENYEEIHQFYLYSLFLQKISNELGYQWKNQANSLCFCFSSRQIFMNLLSIWLHLHPVINRVQSDLKYKQNIPVFNKSYTDQFIKRLESLYAERRRQNDPLKLIINATAVKAICMGFFLTANQTWQQLLGQQGNITPKNPEKSSWMLSNITKKFQQSFKPLMVVTQTLSNIFGRKRVKTSHRDNDAEGMDEQIFGDCYMEFKKTVDLQKKIQRKLSDFCLEDQSDQYELKQKNETITKNEFSDEEAPIEKNVLGSMYEYVTKFIRKRSPWQVASSFVTNILDIQQRRSDEAKVKVLKPAEDFYEKLLLTWITQLQSNQKQQISYQKYLQNVKIAFGRAWKSKYTIPTKYFHDRLIKHWNDIQNEIGIQQKNNQEILRVLITKMRESMKEDWQRKIRMSKKQPKTKQI